MKSKTAMQELIEMIKKTMGNSIDENGFDIACIPFLAKEKQDIIDAYDDGQEDMIKFDQRRSPENYFTQKYKQQ